MTQLIDILQIEGENWAQIPCKVYGNVKGLTSRRISSHIRFKTINQDQFVFLVNGKQNEHDLLFDVRFKHPYTSIKVYLMEKSGQILKISSQSGRIQVIRQFFSEKSLYQLNVDPLSGFVYFRIDYFKLKKTKQFGEFGEFQSMFKRINLMKLWQTARKIFLNPCLSQRQKWKSAPIGNWKASLQIAKTISKMTLSNDIDSLINKIFKEPKTENKEKKLNPSISMFDTFIPSQNQSQSTNNSNQLIKSLKQIQGRHIYLSTLIKRKPGRSNYDQLFINVPTQKKLNDTIHTMQERNFMKESMKLNDAQLGKITINLERIDERIYKDTISLLQSFPRNSEYHFIDKYFKSPINITLLITLSLKDETLSNFLLTNRKTLSLETKLRILIQVYSSVNILWEECKVIFYANNLKRIFVTKNLGVKLRGLNKYYQPQQHEILEQKGLVNQRFSQSILCLTQLYFRLFHSKFFLYVRPSAQFHTQSAWLQHCISSRCLQKMRPINHLPQGINDTMKEYLVCLNYLFLEHLNTVKDIAAKTSQERMNRRIMKEVFVPNNGIGEQRFGSLNRTEQTQKNLLSIKFTSCWLLKILENLAREVD